MAGCRFRPGFADFFRQTAIALKVSTSHPQIIFGGTAVRRTSCFENLEKSCREKRRS